VVHAAKNGSQRAPAKVLVVLVMEKGKPLAEAATAAGIEVVI